MPIGYARLETVKRTIDWGALCKLGYIARRGKFASRRDLVAGPITVLPKNAPARFKRPEVLWQEADQSERLGQVAAIEIVIALPDLEGLSRDNLITLTRIFATIIMRQYKVAVTFAIHNGNRNPHAHLLVTSRTITPGGFAPLRISTLLPTCIGRRNALGNAPAVLDAAPIASIYRAVLELYLERLGRSDTLDLPAPHAEYHVGPVSAVGAVISNAHAIATRPDAEAIFRKLDRIEFNADIKARNTAAIRQIAELTEHLSSAPFRLQQLERLIRRFIGDDQEVKTIVAAVLGETHCFELAGQMSPLLVTNRYLERERAIAGCAEALSGSSRVSSSTHSSSDAFAQSVIRSSSALKIVEASVDTDLGELAGALNNSQTRPVLVSHLAKTRAPVASIPLRPLHWSDKFKLNPGEIAIVDEADALNPTDLLRLLVATQVSNARLIMVRRPPRPGWRRSAILDALSSRFGQDRIGDMSDTDGIASAIVREDLSQYVAAMSETKRCHLLPSRSELIKAALQLIKRNRAAGKAVFVLCPDTDLSAAIALACARSQLHVSIGPSVPEDHFGTVLLLHGAGTYSGRLLPQLMMREVHLIAAQSDAADLACLARQLTLANGQVTSLSFSTRAYRSPSGRRSEPVAGDIPPFSFGAHLPETFDEAAWKRAGHTSLLDEHYAEVHLDLDDCAASNEADQDDDSSPAEWEEYDPDLEFDDDIEMDVDIEPLEDPPDQID